MDSSLTSASARLLATLGMASTDGGVLYRSRRKLAQIEHMLPWLVRAVSSTRQMPRTVIEFGCGKGNLSFFLAHVLRSVGVGSVSILGVDRNQALVEQCQRARDELGWRELDFRAATCDEFRVPRAPALVCALHVCDVVTDQVIATAIDLGAEHIIAAPCCHSTCQRRLREAGHRHEWGYIARCFPLLGSRFSEFVTEAMRCLALRSYGYEVQVREFVSGVATPKNIVLVGSYTGKRSERSRSELRRMQEMLGIQSEVQLSLDRRLAALGTTEPRVHRRLQQHQEGGWIRHV